MIDTVLPASDAPLPIVRRPSIRGESLAVWIIVGVMAGVATAIVWPSPLVYDGAALDPVWLFFIAVAALGAILRRVGLDAVGDGAELVAAFMLVCLLGSFTSAALAWTSLPLADEMLKSADALLGFSWPVMIAAVRDDTRALTVLSYVYVSLGPQPLLLIVLLCATRRRLFAWRFVTAWAIALLLTLAIFPFVPAVGNFAANHIAWGDIPGILVPSGWMFLKVIGGLRDGSITLLGNEALSGIITFPSFHAAGAILLGWGFFQLRLVRIPMLTLNLAMIVSALVIGGHYLVDVIAGIAVALAGIMLAGRIVKTVARSPG